MLLPFPTLLALLPFVVASIKPSFDLPVQGSQFTGDHAETRAIIELAHAKLRLLQTSDQIEPRWAFEEDKEALRRMGIKFMDITDHQDLGNLNRANLELSSQGKGKKKEKKHAHPFPHELMYNKVVKPYIAKLDSVNMHTNLALLTGFHSRYYKSQYGAASGEFLFNLVQNITSVSNQTIHVKQFEHPWGQHSVIARIQGSESNDTVVIGAHQDSANMFLPTILGAPGADDDGSGTVTTLEVLRVLCAGQFKPKNSIEFHWYSAEEGGLLGSQAIFQAYEKEGKHVLAMLQQDMTGYVSKTLDAGLQEALGVITDFVDPDLTKFIKTVIEGYCSIPWVETQCGYACSVSFCPQLPIERGLTDYRITPVRAERVTKVHS